MSRNVLEKIAQTADLYGVMSIHVMLCGGILVPLAGIEPALLAELDFESSASTSSATGAFGRPWPARRSRRNIAAGLGWSTRCEEGRLDRGATPRYEPSMQEGWKCQV